MWGAPREISGGASLTLAMALYLTMTFPVGLSAKINNPVPASQVRFPQFCAIERFCVEGSNKRSDRGAL